MTDSHQQHQHHEKCRNDQTFRVWGPGVYSFTVRAACLEANPHGGYEIRGFGGDVLGGCSASKIS